MAQYALGCGLCVEQCGGTETGPVVTTAHLNCDGLTAEEPRHFLTHLARYVDREIILCSSVEHGMHRGLIT
jgi:hypothetical protein